MMSLSDLAERCEKATGPDYRLDNEIAAAVGRSPPHGSIETYIEGQHGRWFTASLDAAMTLVPEGFDWIIGHTNSGLTIHAEVGGRGGEYQRFAATPALALCAAALRARDAPLRGRAPAGLAGSRFNRG
jgi:hypothetical protein